ncbi:MAG TPA: trypsin-like peptidase domain-containing protein [Bacteroidota bacterium]|nr:trypsin-like peptidase domain-containing protein [Bacteroidota bacterium]
MTYPPGFGVLVEHLRRATVLVGDGGRSGAGSGVIIGPSGTIATNAHVVRAPRTTVQLFDGTTHEAVLKAHDSARDLALLSIGGEHLHAIAMGNSRAAAPGAFVVAVGNPFGFIGAVTVGRLRGMGRVRGLGTTEWIQSDLRLAPGNSGGPLANSAGELIGINAMIAGGTALAVPVESLARFASERESRETLGVALRNVNVRIGHEVKPGLLVTEIAAGSAAEAASLLPGDIVIGAGGAPLGSPEELLKLLEGHQERVIRLQFLRGDRSTVRTTSVLLGTSRSRAA